MTGELPPLEDVVAETRHQHVLYAPRGAGGPIPVHVPRESDSGAAVCAETPAKRDGWEEMDAEDAVDSDRYRACRECARRVADRRAQEEIADDTGRVWRGVLLFGTSGGTGGGGQDAQ